uniref:Voltage-dependent calcium channel subunit alpha-2/delta-1 n=1 Tax=Schistocephalus solidus TaxID=70667 RepID=A0A0X3Q150_SCHSO
MSQKEKLTIDPVFGTISVENKDTSTLLQSVSVVISSTLAKCRTPSFSRILTQTTTTITPVTSEQPLDQTESVDGVTSTIDGISNGTLTDPAQEIQDLYEDLPPLSRRRRGWFEEFIVDDPTGVAQINSILKFILSTDFGNHYYDGHFLSDLIAGLAVIEDWESYPISKDVISRSVFFTSGLGFIYPAKLHGFEEDLTADFANSSLWQRVLDSDGLLFWIQPKMEDPTLPAPVLSHKAPGNNTVVNGNNTRIFLMPNTSTMWTGVPVFEASIPIAPLPRVTIFKGISASQNAISNTFAVAGLTLKETYLQSRLTEFPECSEEKVCYLLDDAALILAANKPALNYQVGHFLGSADPWLMQELLDNMVYSRVKYYDYQSVCDTTELADRNCTSPGTRLMPSLLRGLQRTFSPQIWLDFLVDCFKVLFKLIRVCIALGQFVLGAAGHAGRGDYMSCIKSSYRYYATDGAIFVTSSRASSNAFTSMLMENLMQDAAEIPIAGNETEYFDELPLPPEVPVRPVTSGVFNCSESCTRSWSATPIPETNTKLVVVDPVCPCAPNDVEWHLSPSIAKDITVCEDMQNPRYRRPVQTCTPS